MRKSLNGSSSHFSLRFHDQVAFVKTICGRYDIFLSKIERLKGRTGLCAYLDRKSVRVRDRASIRSILIDIGFFL